MPFSPRLLKLSGVTLSGILLAGSISVQSTFQASVVPVIKPVALHQDTVTPTVMTVASEIKYLQTKDVLNANANASNFPDNRTQLVHIAQVAAKKPQAERKQVSRGSSDAYTIVEHALSLLGTPYVFGGTNKNGFDCSGFTQYILAGSGISLPRTSYSQFSSGVAVDKNDLSPGDLVFFRTYAKGASHVGIYIGDGRFVHADNPRVGVTITSLSSSYYSSRYLGARRYN